MIKCYCFFVAKIIIFFGIPTNDDWFFIILNNSFCLLVLTTH